MEPVGSRRRCATRLRLQARRGYPGPVPVPEPAGQATRKGGLTVAKSQDKDTKKSSKKEPQKTLKEKRAAKKAKKAEKA